MFDMAKINTILLNHGFTPQRDLGAGAQGCVKLCLSTRDSGMYALKITHATDFCAHEVESLASVWNPYVINIYDTFVEADLRFQVLEYCSGGSLESLVAWGNLSEQRTFALCREMLEAVRACHQHGIAHLDIKPQNVLIDKYGRAKLADFGLSHRTSGGEAIRPRGTFFYMAPEMIDGKQYDPLKADIWSLGVTIYYLWAGDIPWPKERTQCLMVMRNGLDQADQKVPLDVATVLRRMINMVPEVRPSCDELLELPVFAPQQEPAPALIPLLRTSSLRTEMRRVVAPSPQFFRTNSMRTLVRVHSLERTLVRVHSLERPLATFVE
jgi:serine/threonine protein kinase